MIKPSALKQIYKNQKKKTSYIKLDHVKLIVKLVDKIKQKQKHICDEL